MPFHDSERAQPELVEAGMCAVARGTAAKAYFAQPAASGKRSSTRRIESLEKPKKSSPTQGFIGSGSVGPTWVGANFRSWCQTASVESPKKTEPVSPHVALKTG